MNGTIKAERIYRVATSAYRFELDLNNGCWSFCAGKEPAPILVSRAALLLAPEFATTGIVPGSVRAQWQNSGQGKRLLLNARLGGGLEGEVQNEITFMEDRLVCSSNCMVDREGLLAHWHVAPAGSQLACDRVHAYIVGLQVADNGREFSPDDMDISTASHNWLYCPLSPRIVARKGPLMIGIGGTTLAHDFGLNLCVQKGTVRHFRFDYGGAANPMHVPGKACLQGPRLQLQVSSAPNTDRAHGAFIQAMISDGVLTPRRNRPQDEAWRRGWYCTFGDQMAFSKKDPAAQFNATHYLDEAFVLKAARTIRDNKLNIGTLIVDEGWQDKRGDWNLNTQRFPDMRRLVDRLHAMDFKVVLWWAPFIVAEEARILEEPGLTIANAKYGHRVMDYTNPAARDYIQKKLDLWFGHDPDGWDLDGMKVDFMAENVYPGSRPGDTDWRGEERLMHNLFQMIHRAIARHKDSPGLLGEAFSPFLAQYCIAFQFEERFDRDLSYLDTRPAMAAALLPGAWVAPHFTYHTDLVCSYVRKVQANGGIPQIAKILAPDVTPEIMNELRQLLDG